MGLLRHLLDVPKDAGPVRGAGDGLSVVSLDVRHRDTAFVFLHRCYHRLGLRRIVPDPDETGGGVRNGFGIFCTF